MLWKERNGKDFEDLEPPRQAIELSFISTFLEWVRLYIGDYSITMIGIDWISSNEKGFVFCFFSLSFACLFFW